MIGSKLGVYEIVSRLGEGGMGDVYRARDRRLGRDVALKVLQPSLAADPASLSRFEREARLVAALNHPNIVALFDIGRAAGVDYMVTELVDGATLQGATLPTRKVAEVGAQIADALAAAHDAGVIHRDIKPGNVMLTREGRVKLLDFGVAAPGPEPRAGDVTMTRTTAHTVVGTAGYMAPEHVRGEPADARADIFALGVLLHELLSGARPFGGGTTAEVMTATLRADPPELPPAVPPALRLAVRRCLEKNPEERFQSARDLAFVLRQLTGAPVADALPAPAARKRLALRVGVLAFVAGLLAAGAVVRQWHAAQDAVIDPIRLTRLTSDRRNEIQPAVSADGQSLAYLRIGGGVPTDLLVKPIDTGDAVTLTRSATALNRIAWTADGNQVCYGDVRRDNWCVGAAGGAPRRVLADAAMLRTTPDGRDMFFIRVHDKAPWLFRARAGGEAVRVGGALPIDLNELSPVSPDGRWLVAAFDRSRWLIALPDGTRQRDWAVDANVRTASMTWLPDSRHLAVAEVTTAVIGARLVLMDTRGAARRDVLHTGDQIESVTATADGTRLVYSTGPVERDLAEYSSAGTLVRTVAASSILEGVAAWSPTGDRFVYRAGGPGQSDRLWLGSDAGSAPAPIQQLTGNSLSPTPISPDGGRVAYIDTAGIFVVPVSGGRAVQALASTDVPRQGLCWSPDGNWIWFSDRPTRVGRVPSGGGAPAFVDGTPGPLLACSPDGRWLLHRGNSAFVLMSADGTIMRDVAGRDGYGAGAASTAQFGEGGKVLYLLGLDRRSVEVIDVESGRPLRTIAFDVPIEDRIEQFSFSPDGSRVLVTIGGDRNDIWMVEGFARPAAPWRRWFSHWESPAR